MENRKDLEMNAMTDAELEQVDGGGKLWDAVTAEFHELFDRPKMRKLPMEDEDGKGTWDLTTLEMRVKTKERQKKEDGRKVIKL